MPARRRRLRRLHLAGDVPQPQRRIPHRSVQSRGRRRQPGPDAGLPHLHRRHDRARHRDRRRPTDGATTANASPSSASPATRPGDTAKLQCQLDGGAFADCTSPKTFSGLSDGSHTVTFRAEDALGNRDATPASRTFTVDTSPPDTLIESGPAEGATITTDSATYGFRGDPIGDTAKVQCKLDGEAFADCTSQKTFSGLANGSHTVSFRAQDAAGNQDPTPASRTFTVNVATPPPPPDTTPPDTAIDSGPDDGATITTNSATFTFHGTAGDTAKVQCKLDGEAFADCTSQKTFSGLANGSHTVSFRAQDAAGNQDPTPASRTFTVNVTTPPPPDTTPPNTVINSGPSGTITTATATFTFAGSPSSDTAELQCKLDSAAFADCTSPKTFSGLAEGPHTVSFRAVDASGNVDPTPVSRAFTVELAPPPDSAACDKAEAAADAAADAVAKAEKALKKAKKSGKKSKIKKAKKKLKAAEKALAKAKAAVDDACD